MRTNLKRSLASCLAVAFVVALAAGCQSPPPTPPAPPTSPTAPDAAAESALPAAEQDTCKAASYASLIGQDYKQAPPAPAGKVIRVVCTTCPMTMDFNAERLNVIYDEKSGLIRRLTCG